MHRPRHITRRGHLLPASVVAAFLAVSVVTAQRADVLPQQPGAGADPAAAQERAGVPGTVQGAVVTLEELLNRTRTAPLLAPRQASPRRTFDGSMAPAPGLQVQAGAPGAGGPEPIGASPELPQALVDEIIGPGIADTLGFVPPDTMGAVGPTQFLFSVNTHLRAFNKNSPHTQIWDIDEQAFWGSTADPSGVSDTHVRYDRTSQRWFITEIDVPSGDNHILLAVSSGPDLSTASWTQFAIPTTSVVQDAGCFADYDTPGIDQSAIYIGENMFGGLSNCPGNYLHTNLYVVQKASALTLTLHYTQFFNVVSGTVGIATIQGVDSVDPLSTGYAVAVNETESPRQHLNVWQINNPGTTSPTLSGPTAVAISAENGARGGVLSLNNAVSAHSTRPMDDIDDRLFSAVIRNGHLWTAHNIGVDSSGNANGGARTRDAVRWFDINVSGLTLNQSGTVFDGAASGFLEYWMGTVMVSGQGHVAMGLNRANSTTTVQAGAVGRLAGDPANTMSGFSLFQNSVSTAYDDGGFVPNPANRWGDYTYTSLDPCDDMTMWTAQEYVAGSTFGVGWGVAAEKLQAPGPASLTSAIPSNIAAGQASVNVNIVGTSMSGSGFYDTPSTITDACRQRIGAVVSGGVTVNSITYTDPTHVTLNLSTVGTTPGVKSVTITNPDGQTSTNNSLITVVPPAVVTADSVMPASGTGFSQTFALQYSDTAGATDLSTAWVFFTQTFTSGTVNSCMAYYNRAGNTLYLLNDAATAWMPAGIGSAGTLQNSQCAIAMGGTTAVPSGNMLTLNLAMTFKGAYAGAKNVYMFANNGAVSSGWQQRGTWTVPAATVTADSVMPASGTGLSQTFALQYSDSLGATDLSTAWVFFTQTFASGTVNSCMTYYNRAANTLYLLNDAATAWMPAAIGSVGTLQNSQCAINMGGTTAVPSGNTLTLNLAMTFKPAYAGVKNVYMFANNGASSSGWQQRGTWTVPGVTVTADSVSPSSGTGFSQTFALQYSDTAGATDLATVWVFFTPTFTSGNMNSCMAYYNRAANTLYLLNDAATVWMPAIVGSGGTLQNSQCAIAMGTTTAVPSGNMLTLNLAMTFRPAYNGAKNVYMFAGDGTVSSGWQQRGTWTVPVAVVTADSVMPASGTGSSQAFALQYSDTAGAADLGTAWVFFTPTFASGNVSSCMAYYNRAANTLYLLNDAGTVWMPAVIGSTGTLQNSQCAIAMGGTTAVPSGNTLTLDLAMTFFTPAYTGAKNVYMFAGNGAVSSGWQQRGTWTVP